MHTILAARTDFSVGESILSASKLIEFAKASSATAVGITDTMSITSMIDFTRKAEKDNIKPIIGCRLRISDNPSWRPEKGQKKRHMPKEVFLTAYVMSEDGLKALFRLLTLGNSESRFYYTSKISFKDLALELKRLPKGALNFHLGDANGLITHPNAKARIDVLTALAGAENIFAPLIPVNTPYFGRINELSMKFIDDGIQPIVVYPSYYGNEEADAHEVMTAIASNNSVTSPFHPSSYNRDFHILNSAELAKACAIAAGHLKKRGLGDIGKHFKQGLANTKVLVDRVNYVWEKADISLPKMADDEFTETVRQCKIGWKERFGSEVFGHQPDQKELEAVYKERLVFELDILKRLSFSGYFLLVQDVVKFAKKSDILVGPGRGSVGGSLVAYLMGITDCDPIRFGLMFERFINPDRLDLPDADLDFMSGRRQEVIDYLIDKYGQERVCGVSNFGTLAAASSIRDVSRVFDLPTSEYSISKFVPKLHGANVPLPDCAEQVPEIRNFADKYPVHWDIMERLEGTIRNFGSHAAGVVVAGVDIVDRGVVERRKESSVVCWDKRIVEDQGLVKMDILGLNTLDLISAATKYIFERHAKKVDLMKVPLDDQSVLDNFANGKTTGVFQFESGGMRRLLKELGQDGTLSFEDVVAATALYRPGPMESGMMDSYFKRKQGIEDVEYDHPLMKPILQPTFGVIVYQEQVMKISQAICGYSGAEADKLRKIMGKKQPEEMRKERGKFCDGAVKTTECTEEWAGELFDKIEGFAGYGFNRSHSVEYSLISWQCMWLKTYYPAEFFAAALSLMGQDKLKGIIKDANSMGISVNVPDINISTDRFEIVTDVRMVMPFNRIKGLSVKTSAAIMKAREAGPFANKQDFLDRVEKRSCNVRHQAALEKVGAFSRIENGLHADDPSRIREQLELLPGLITATVPIDRDLESDKATKQALGKIVQDYKEEYGPDGDVTDGMPVTPFMGKKPQFMLITDCPNNPEDQAGTMSIGMASAPVIDAMAANGIDRNAVYWTALVKRPKTEKQITLDEIQRYWKYMTREIDVLKPPAIVLMGSQTVRHFIPDFAGKASDGAGQIIYSKEYDTNFVIGFNPGELYFSPEKMANMEEVFKSVCGLINV